MTDGPLAPTALPALNCYVISDGRRGIENQALGLTEALARHIQDTHRLEILPYKMTHSAAFKAASPKLQFAMKSRPQDYGLPKDKAPHMAIGCGRQAIAPLLAMKKAFPDVMTIYVQDPRIDVSKFDLVIAPEHDGLRGDNVEPMIGSPNRVTDELIIGETLNFNGGLITLPMPRAAMLIGGESKTHRYTPEDLAAHIKAAKDLLAGGLSLMITTSRRTPEFAQTAFEALEAEHDNIWLHSDAKSKGGPNPYFAFLGGAEIILVTQDSTNMLTESCSTGKPVFILPMLGKAGLGKANEGKSGKFQQLYDHLTARCNVVPYAGQLSGADYEPLEETPRVAQRLWERYTQDSKRG